MAWLTTSTYVSVVLCDIAIRLSWCHKLPIIIMIFVHTSEIRQPQNKSARDSILVKDLSPIKLQTLVLFAPTTTTCTIYKIIIIIY